VVFGGGKVGIMWRCWTLDIALERAAWKYIALKFRGISWEENISRGK